MVGENMQRVTRAKPCPICDKSDWCLVASDGSAAICARVKERSAKKCGDAGYLHILIDRHDGHDRHRGGARGRHTLTLAQKTESRTQDFEQTCAQCQSRLTGERLHALARSLRVSCESLRRLRIGWDGNAYTFPMADASGTVIGIRRRFPNGRKASIKGSKTGLFIPLGLGGKGPLLIC